MKTTRTFLALALLFAPSLSVLAQSGGTNNPPSELRLSGASVTINLDGSVTVTTKAGKTVQLTAQAALPATCTQGALFFKSSDGIYEGVSTGPGTCAWQKAFSVALAAVGVNGIAATSVAPDSPSAPIVVSDNDPRAGIRAEAYASLAAAVTALGSNVRRLVVGQSQTISANLTIPDTLTLEIAGDAILTVPTGVTLTINRFDPGDTPRQYFNVQGTGRVLFGLGALTEYHIDWFGAKGDSTGNTAGTGTDSTAAINAAIQSIPAGGGGVLVFGSGYYRVTDSSKVIDNITNNYRFGLRIRGQAGYKGSEASGSAGTGGGNPISRIKWDGAATTLSGAVVAGDTTLPLTSAAGFNTSGGWAVISPREVVKYTGVSGNSLTGVTRGVGVTTNVAGVNETVPGTAANSYAAGTAVYYASPVFKIYSREVTASQLQISVANGKATVAAFDLDRAASTGDMNSTGPGNVGPRISTANGFNNNYISTGYASGGTGKMIYGARIGQSSNFNIEFNRVESNSFSYQEVAGIYVPSTTRQSKSNLILDNSFTTIPYAVWLVTGSINAERNTTAGMYRGIYRLDSPGDSINIIGGNHESDARFLDVTVGGSVALAPVNVMGGRYTTNALNGSTTLTSNISASDTTIPVTTTASFYPGGGVLKIDNEYLFVGRADTNATSFTNITRGAYGSTPAAHTAGAAVTNDGRFINFNSGGALTLTNVDIGDAQPANNFSINSVGGGNIICIGSSFPNITPFATTPTGGGNTYFLTSLGCKGVNGAVNVFAPVPDEISYRNDPTNPTAIADRGPIKQYRTQFTGGVAFPYVRKQVNYTLTKNDFSIGADAAGAGSFTLTLPDVASVPIGTRYTMKRLDATAFTVTIATTGGQTIDGAASYNLAPQYATVTVENMGSGWNVVAKF